MKIANHAKEYGIKNVKLPSISFPNPGSPICWYALNAEKGIISMF